MSDSDKKEWSKNQLIDIAADVATEIVGDYDMDSKIDNWWRDVDLHDELDRDTVFELIEKQIDERVKKIVDNKLGELYRMLVAEKREAELHPAF